MFERTSFYDRSCACRACLATGLWRAWVEVAAAVAKRADSPMDWCGAA